MLLKPLKPGRKPRIGSVQFIGRKMYFYFGQTECEHCAENYTLLMDIDNARILAKMFGNGKPGIKARIARGIEKWASDGRM